MREKIWGKVIDEEGRCTHYHQENDIVALKCSDCEKYFSCYHCHDELENHVFRATDKEDFPVLCGHCGTKLNFNDYSRGECIKCSSAFNPNCHRHWQVYFNE
mgnify:FL=1